MLFFSRIAGAVGGRDPTPLAGLEKLTCLDLTRCARLPDLEVPRALHRLTHLEVSGRESLEDLDE